MWKLLHFGNGDWELGTGDWGQSKGEEFSSPPLFNVQHQVKIIT
ncbi:hypothetical protein [Nostoc sp.]